MALPFRRFDVVDASLHVVLRGTTADRLEPVTRCALEPELAAEVRRIVRESSASAAATTVGVGLLGLDHGVRVVRCARVGPGFFLICLERISLRGPFERLAARFCFNDDERELARLIVAGHDLAAIAFRSGRAPGDSDFRVRQLLDRLSLPNREALVHLVYPRAAERRRRHRTAAHENVADSATPA